MKYLLTLLLALTLVGGVAAKEAAPLAEDPAVEQRLNTIAEEMRCLVCQNESLAASRSDLALDLRREIREQIQQGKTDEEIRTFMVSRYGDFVLYRPPVKSTTFLLWVGPFALVIIAVALLIVYLRRRNRQVSDTTMTEEERQHVEKLLRGDRHD